MPGATNSVLAPSSDGLVRICELRIWVNGWPAGFVTASMVRILLEERLGFKAIEQGPGWNTVEAQLQRMTRSAPT